MINGALVSIIIPVYNSEKHLQRCVESILNQDYENLEIILINDGSTDKSNLIMEHLAIQDIRVIIINKQNEGVAKTRNLGLQLATGKYVMFVDNDDFVSPTYVKSYVNYISKFDLDIVIGGYQRVNNHGSILFSDFPRDSNWGKYVILAPWAKIYNLQFLKTNNILFLDYPIGEDIFFNLFAFSKTKKIKAIPEKSYSWFFNENSISNTSQTGFDSRIDVVFLLKKLLDITEDPDNEYFKYFIKRYYIWFLLFSGKKATPKEFVSQYKRIKDWIQKNSLQSDLNPLSKKLSGEGYKNRIIVLIFTILEKFYLIPVFAKIYCR